MFGKNFVVELPAWFSEEYIFGITDCIPVTTGGEVYWKVYTPFLGVDRYFKADELVILD